MDRERRIGFLDWLFWPVTLPFHMMRMMNPLNYMDSGFHGSRESDSRTHPTGGSGFSDRGTHAYPSRGEGRTEESDRPAPSRLRDWQDPQNISRDVRDWSEEVADAGRRAGRQIRQSPPRPGQAVDPESTTKEELYEMAKELEVEGRSRMTKKELAQAVSRQSSRQTGSAQISSTDLAEKMTKEELYEEAKRLDLEGRSKMDKEQLARALARQAALRPHSNGRSSH